MLRHALFFNKLGFVEFHVIVGAGHDPPTALGCGMQHVYTHLVDSAFLHLLEMNITWAGGS